MSPKDITGMQYKGETHMKELELELRRIISRGPFVKKGDKEKYRKAQRAAVGALEEAVGDLYYGATGSARILIENALGNIKAMEKSIYIPARRQK